MALYSVSVKPVSRGGGRSATAAAAYRNAERITDERTGEIHDYSRRTGVDYVESFAPVGTVAQSSSELWNKAEATEVRKNARVAREVLVALPHELDQVQRRKLAKAIADGLAKRYNAAGTLAVHHPDREGDNRNHHAHILMTTRRIDAAGQLGEKTRELDDVKRGPQEVEWIRGMVESYTNLALEQAGVESRVDRRSLDVQRNAALSAGDAERAAELDRPATQHEGPRVTQIRREAARADRAPLGALDRAAVNDQVRQLAADRAELRQIAEVINLAEYRAAKLAEETQRPGESKLDAMIRKMKRDRDAAAEKRSIIPLTKAKPESAKPEPKAVPEAAIEAVHQVEKSKASVVKSQFGELSRPLLGKLPSLGGLDDSESGPATSNDHEIDF